MAAHTGHSTVALYSTRQYEAAFGWLVHAIHRSATSTHVKSGMLVKYEQLDSVTYICIGKRPLGRRWQ